MSVKELRDVLVPNIRGSAEDLTKEFLKGLGDEVANPDDPQVVNCMDRIKNLHVDMLTSSPEFADDFAEALDQETGAMKALLLSRGCVASEGLANTVTNAFTTALSAIGKGVVAIVGTLGEAAVKGLISGLGSGDAKEMFNV